MNLLREKITAVAEQAVSEMNLLLIDVVLRGNERNRVIEIYIDGADSVSAETCAHVSRVINNSIIADDIITSSYRLDVSTPGVDRPLKFLSQFNKHISRKFSVEYLKDEQKQTLEGKLIDIQDDTLIFDSGNEVHIKFSSIIKATVKVSFS